MKKSGYLKSSPAMKGLTPAIRVIINPYNAGLFLYKPLETKGFFQLEIIINVLVSSFRFIRVYGQYKYLNSFSAGIDFIRQNLTLTYKDGPRSERVKVSDDKFQGLFQDLSFYGISATHTFSLADGLCRGSRTFRTMTFRPPRRFAPIFKTFRPRRRDDSSQFKTFRPPVRRFAPTEDVSPPM